MIKNYFITALRNFSRNKFFSLVNILGLSIGIACCMLIFLYAKDEISFDRFHEKKDRICRVTADISDMHGLTQSGSTGMMPGPAFKDHVPGVEDYVRIQSAGFNIKHGGEVIEQDALYADENIFSVFSFPLLYGDPKTALKGLHSIVISENSAEKYFGRANVVGRVLELNVNEKWVPFVVSGVAKNSPQNSSIHLDILLPMKFNQSLHDDKIWMNFFLNTFVVLKPGTSITNTEKNMNRIFLSEAKEQIKEGEIKYGNKNKVTFKLQPLLSMHLSTDYIADNGLSNASSPLYSYILTSIAIFVLIIACINFINLTVARSLKRAKEIGIRKVVGSQRKQLIIQFLGESFIFSFFSFILAVILANCALPFFNSLANKNLAFSYLLDFKLITGYLSLFILTGLLAGFYPALVLSRFNPVETLCGKFRFTGKNYLSKGLIVLQFTLATFLIIAAVTIYSQFNYLINFDRGMDDANVLRTYTPPLKDDDFDLLKSELKKNSSIAIVTGEQRGTWGTLAHINGAVEQDFNFRHVDENYFPLFGIPLVEGRNFIKASHDSAESMIVNQSFIKAAGWRNPIGETIDFFYNKKKYKVVGVIKDYHFASLIEKVKPQAFNMSKNYRYGTIFIKAQKGKKIQAGRYIEKVCRALYPMQPYQYRWMDEAREQDYENEAKWKQIISFSAILTIFISCIGLFGLAALSAEKRAKEIGIRKVLGASVTLIVQKLSLDFLKLVAIAACIAVPNACWLMNKWLENYPYRIEIGSGMIGFTLITVLMLAFLTVSLQAFRTAVANPVKNLRTE